MSPLTSPPVLDALPVQLRLIQRATTGTAVLGATLAAQAPLGINGAQGYQSGTFEPPLSEQGSMTVTLPNGAGADGRLHRTRFDCLTDATYNQGDEWIEVWHGIAGRGRLLFVGTPTDWRVSRSTITLTLGDGTGPLELQRETAAGFWWHAPRDVFEHYTKAWHTIVADDFVGGLDAARWTPDTSAGGTITNQASAVRFTPAVGAGTSTNISRFGAFWAPGVNLVTSVAWRAECRYSQALVGGAGVAFQLTAGGGGDGATIQTSATGTVEAITSGTGALSPAVFIESAISSTAADVTLAIERHDRWLFFYAQGTLVFAVEAPAWASGTAAYPEFALVDYTGGATGTVDLDYIIVRDVQPYLMRGTDKGDYRLPSDPTSGGLRGIYYDEADLRVVGDTTTAFYLRVLSPIRKPFARRQDATINFATATPPAWMPVGTNGEYFSVRWTGAIYLDLATADVTLRLASLNNGARLYVGKTMFGQHLLQQWANPTAAPYTLTSGSLRTHTGASLAGWYPIRLEYVQGVTAGGIILQQSIAAGAYAVVPATSLSPYGIVESEVRYDSFSEQLKSVVDAFGYQYRCEPRSLESGTFPGEVVPRIRVGRDTDKVLSPSESTDVQLSGSAQDTIQTLLADAAGLADPANAAQLTSESVDFPAIWPPAVADRHMMTTTAYESLADITDPGLLATRLAAMLGLRLSPWEEIGARPRGSRELRDTFPLTGVMALFAWEPGDGIRIVDEQLGFADTSPRQIIAPSWPFGPDGLGAPSVRFRQRPRSQQDALRDLVRAVLLPQRNYQGQLVIVNGTQASSPVTALIDNFTIVSLPLNAADLVRCELVVQIKTDASAGTISVNSVSTGITLNTTGRYDLTAFAARSAATAPRMYANVAGHTGTAEYTLELLVRV